VNARTDYQETLLGDGPGSDIAWTLYRAGYERGVQSGYVDGYAEGLAIMHESHGLLVAWREDQDKVEAARHQTARRLVKADRRTGAQIVAAAHESWGTMDRKDAAA
jgi:hypothetical protein